MSDCVGRRVRGASAHRRMCASVRLHGGKAQPRQSGRARVDLAVASVQACTRVAFEWRRTHKYNRYQVLIYSNEPGRITRGRSGGAGLVR